MTDSQALLVLNAVPGLGSAGLRVLLKHFGSPSCVMEEDCKVLAQSSLLAPEVIENIIHFSKDKFLEREYNLINRKGIQVVTIADDAYPACLKEIPGAPVVLYIQGDVNLLYSASVAMVGSRIVSYYGLTIAQRFAERFAQAGLVVVSGLARGIDTASHKACLKAGGKTVAVLGCGLNHIYPKENQELRAEIVKEGAVISELPMDAPPIPANFPRRNRIISGLSLATVVVEAGVKSGALITVGYALEQGRDVYAVPANIDIETAEGSNRLLKDGAHVALSADDVLEGLKSQMELEFLPLKKEEKKENSVKIGLNDSEKSIYQLLSLQPVHMDELVAGSGRDISQLSSVVLNLELKQMIRQLPGQYYVRV